MSTTDFSFVVFAFGVISRNHCQIQCFPFPFIFSSRNFTVLCLVFRSLTWFELTLVYGVNIGIQFHSFISDNQFPNTVCERYSPFPTEWSWHVHQKWLDQIHIVVCLGIFLNYCLHGEFRVLYIFILLMLSPCNLKYCARQIGILW